MEDKILLLDGGMGTMLQRHGVEPGQVAEVLNITDPELITGVHREYVQAGSDVVYTNTFGCNRYKLKDCGYSVPEIVGAAVDNARAACGPDTRVAVSIGPLGQMLEPAGTVKFEEAYEAFKEIAQTAGQSGADLIVIETMTDLYEMKAAVLAARENTDLPVIASMSFEASGRTFTGCSIEAMAATLEGLGVSAVGINCSLGPAEIYPLAERLCKATSLPVFVKPNAGLPNPEDGSYNIDADEFVSIMEKYTGLGIAMMGGCCGTDPDYICGLSKMLGGKEKPERQPVTAVTRVCTPTRVVDIDHVTVCGERLNPTGKKRLKQAMQDKDINYILKLAVQQEEEGAEILDINAGVPGIDQVSFLPELIKKIQQVTDLPLQIDSSEPAAIEAALRVYNGKAIVNSVNGEEKSMEAILPIVKKYGACVIALTLDEDGIPQTTEKRLEIADRIVKRAESLGIPRENIIADCLTLTASAQQDGAKKTLAAIERVKSELGLKTALGVSNISFGLPARPLVNRTFLTLAIQCGLDIPIINPADEEMMDAIAACDLLLDKDKNAARYIERLAGRDSAGSEEKSGNAAELSARKGADQEGDLYHSLLKGLEEDTRLITEKLLESEDEMTVVADHLIPALDKIGKGFEEGRIFLPQMIQAAGAAQAGFEAVKASLLGKGGKNISMGKVIIATVKGDVHDIGKNIVKVIMENYGFEMIDLGKDVSPEKILETAIENDVKIVGLSALMTTTLKSMEETIVLLKENIPDCRILVGGAVLTEEYAEKIGADYYCKDAMKSVEAARDAVNMLAAD